MSYQEHIIRSINTLAVLLVSLTVFGQQSIVPGKVEHAGAERPALEARLNVPMDAAKDAFKEFMHSKYAIRVKGLGFLQNKDLLTMEKVHLPAVYEHTMDLFAFFSEVADDQVNVALFGREGYDLYFGPGHAPDVQQRLEKVLHDYQLYALEVHYKALLEDQRARQEDLKRRQEKAGDAISDDRDRIKDNLKENKKLRKKIEKLEEEMEERSRNLERLQDDIERTKTEIPASVL